MINFTKHIRHPGNNMKSTESPGTGRKPTRPPKNSTRACTKLTEKFTKSTTGPPKPSIPPGTESPKSTGPPKHPKPPGVDAKSTLKHLDLLHPLDLIQNRNLHEMYGGSWH